MQDPTMAGATGRSLPLTQFDAAIFDLDGVVTRTARVHAATWKRLFDDYLRDRSARTGEPFREFTEADYRAQVDGLPRYDGVAAFLASRGIDLPRGDPSDPPGSETVCGLGNRKNALFRQVLEADGVEVFASSVDLIRRLRGAGLKTGLVSSSRNARAVLDAAKLTELFDVIVDGNDAARIGLKGKPDPDAFLLAAEHLGVAPARSAMFEDALSGVAAGRAGGFGLVVGVDRAGHGEELHRAGADIVVADIGELRASAEFRPEMRAERGARILLPGHIAPLLRGRRPAVFLDYDGTLTPIVARPELAVLSDDMRAAVRRLARSCPVAIVSGRDRADVERLVGIGELVYAGSHGFDIAGPGGLRIEHETGRRVHCCGRACIGVAARRARAGGRCAGRAKALRGRRALSAGRRRRPPGRRGRRRPGAGSRAGAPQDARQEGVRAAPALRVGQGEGRALAHRGARASTDRRCSRSTSATTRPTRTPSGRCPGAG